MLIRNGKLLGLINILDLLVLLGVVTAAILLAPKFIRSSDNAAQGAVGAGKSVYFTLEFSQAGQELADKASVGDHISDNLRGYYYGVVTDIYSAPAKKVVPNLETGVFENADLPGLVDVFITIKANGSESDREILAEGQPIKIGKQMNVKGKGYCSAGYVVDLYTE